MRKMLLVPLIAIAAAGCATPAPEARWRDPGTVTVPLVSTWPPTVRVKIAGEYGDHPVRLMLDTGAEESAIDDSIADVLDLAKTWHLNSVQGFDTEQGGVGHRTVFQREARSVELPGGALRLERLRFVPLPMPASRDGVLGLAAFPGRAVIIDPARSKVSFVPREQVSALAAKEGAIGIPVRREGNLLLAKVELRGNAGPKKIDAVLDTGAADSFVTDEPGPEAYFGVWMGSIDAGKHTFRVEHGGNFCTLGGDVLLNLGRPVLFDLEGEKVILLPAGGN